MTEEPDEPPRDPAWDPAVRQRVQRSVDELVATARDVLARYTDHDGFYEAPDPVPFGDVTGLINASYEQVVRRLRDSVDATRDVMRDVLAEVDDYKRQQYGNYDPVRRDL